MPPTIITLADHPLASPRSEPLPGTPRHQHAKSSSPSAAERWSTNPAANTWLRVRVNRLWRGLASSKGCVRESALIVSQNSRKHLPKSAQLSWHNDATSGMFPSAAVDSREISISVMAKPRTINTRSAARHGCAPICRLLKPRSAKASLALVSGDARFADLPRRCPEQARGLACSRPTEGERAHRWQSLVRDVGSPRPT
jgi:hypothetical protein